jgi:UDP-glucuronate 4-epimerase
MKVLVTGAAGFIGMHVALQLLRRGDAVVGLDNLNDYYDTRLKLARLDQLKTYKNFDYVQGDIADPETVERVFASHAPQRVVHLAAQAGVRYSLENPQSYVQSNLVGFSNVLEACRQHQVAHFVYASSSSVYGANTHMPYSVHDNVDHPLNLYAASKKANELVAHSYSHLFRLPTTGLRYFTVYGPWGRPDMAPWLFTSAIDEGRSINVFNQGQMLRDFTFIDDIAQATVAVLDRAAQPCDQFNRANPDPATSDAPYKIYNIGNQQPVALLDFISGIEKALGKKAIQNLLPMQAGYVAATYADVSDLQRDIGFEPSTPLAEGLQSWTRWYLSFKQR